MDEKEIKDKLLESMDIESLRVTEKLIQRTLQAAEKREDPHISERDTKAKPFKKMVGRIALTAAGIMILAAGSIYMTASRGGGDVDHMTSDQSFMAGNGAAESGAVGSAPLEGAADAAEPEAICELQQNRSKILLTRRGGEELEVADPAAIDRILEWMKSETEDKDSKENQSDWQYHVVVLTGEEVRDHYILKQSAHLEEIDELYNQLLEK